MKKQIFNYLTLLSILLIFSCSTDSKEQNENLQQIDKYQSELIENSKTKEISTKYQNATFLKGNFQTIKSKDNQVALFTETNDFKHIFIINDISKNDVLKIENIKSLSYLKNGIVLNSDIFVSVEGNSDENLKKDSEFLSSKSNLNEINSKNIIYYWVPKSNSKDVTAEELIQSANRIALQHEGDCEQGGEGSTSCSVTSNSGAGCSVSCGTGYYACCNETAIGPNDCHCHKA